MLKLNRIISIFITIAILMTMAVIPVSAAELKSEDYTFTTIYSRYKDAGSASWASSSIETYAPPATGMSTADVLGLYVTNWSTVKTIGSNVFAVHFGIEAEEDLGEKTFTLKANAAATFKMDIKAGYNDILMLIDKTGKAYTYANGERVAVSTGSGSIDYFYLGQADTTVAAPKYKFYTGYCRTYDASVTMLSVLEELLDYKPVTNGKTETSIGADKLDGWPNATVTVENGVGVVSAANSGATVYGEFGTYIKTQPGTIYPGDGVFTFDRYVKLDMDFEVLSQNVTQLAARPNGVSSSGWARYDISGLGNYPISFIADMVEAKGYFIVNGETVECGLNGVWSLTDVRFYGMARGAALNEILYKISNVKQTVYGSGNDLATLIAEAKEESATVNNDVVAKYDFKLGLYKDNNNAGTTFATSGTTLTATVPGGGNSNIWLYTTRDTYGISIPFDQSAAANPIKYVNYHVDITPTTYGGGITTVELASSTTAVLVQSDDFRLGNIGETYSVDILVDLANKDASVYVNGVKVGATVNKNLMTDMCLTTIRTQLLPEGASSTFAISNNYARAYHGNTVASFDAFDEVVFGANGVKEFDYDYATAVYNNGEYALQTQIFGADFANSYVYIAGYGANDTLLFAERILTNKSAKTVTTDEVAKIKLFYWGSNLNPLMGIENLK